MDWSAVQTVLIVGVGAGIFLRLVCKEKQRREKHLQFRLDEQIRKLREEKEKAEAEAAAKAAREQEGQEAQEDQAPVVLQPV